MPKQTESTAKQMAGFIAKFDPANAKLIRAARSAMRKRYPTATELVYDNYNFFVIGYSPTARPSDSIFSIAAASNGVGIAFLQGATLKDPDGLLQRVALVIDEMKIDAHLASATTGISRLVLAFGEEGITRSR